jgi:ribosomal protein S18 acetylase RimI-like enzyme
MYVLPEARSLGVGSRLLDRLLEAAAESGFTVVRLDTADFMDSAHRLYRSERDPNEPLHGLEVGNASRYKLGVLSLLAVALRLESSRTPI